MNTPASAVASDSSVEAATSPAPSLTISLRVRRAADAAGALGAETRL